MALPGTVPYYFVYTPDDVKYMLRDNFDNFIKGEAPLCAPRPLLRAHARPRPRAVGGLLRRGRQRHFQRGRRGVALAAQDGQPHVFGAW
jgi:hypothetical protein